MGATPVFQIPYPEPSDPVANYPTTGQALAQKVESIHLPGATITNAMTAAAGWALSAQNVKVMGKLALFQATFTRTGAAIAVPVNGDIGNVAVVTLNPAAIGATALAFAGPICSHSVGRLASYQAAGNGLLSLSAVGGSGGTIAVNEAMSLIGMTFLT